MAYAISESLLQQIYATIDKVATMTGDPTPRPSEPDGYSGDSASWGWFAIDGLLTLGGKGTGRRVSLTLNPTQTGNTKAPVIVPRFKGTKTTTIVDGLYRATDNLTVGSIVLCLKVDRLWNFWAASNYPMMNRASWVTATPTDAATVTGDPNTIYIGKTVSAINKGSSGWVNIYNGSDTLVTAAEPGQSSDTQVRIWCNNRFADIDADKWVRVTGNGELLTAEC